MKHVGARLLKEGRRSDALCRIGGEEFLVVCSGSDLRSAMTAGERLRRAIETMTLAARGNEDIKLSISVGIAQKEHDTPSIDALLLAADKAMYSAKHAGRNRVHIMLKGKVHQCRPDE